MADGSIRNDEQFAQRIAWGDLGLPRGVQPTDVDMAFDNGRHLVEFEWKYGLDWEFGSLPVGQRRHFELKFRAYGDAFVLVVVSHVGVGSNVTLEDVNQFRLVARDGDFLRQSSPLRGDWLKDFCRAVFNPSFSAKWVIKTTGVPFTKIAELEPWA